MPAAKGTTTRAAQTSARLPATGNTHEGAFLLIERRAAAGSLTFAGVSAGKHAASTLAF